MKSAALLTGPEFHELDHIAPLASLFRMPLIVTDETCATLAKRFYPEVELRLWVDLEFRMKELADEFDTLFTCKFWSPNVKTILRDCHGKEMRLAFCPHGQSDKGYGAPLLAPFALQDLVLLYGDLMKEMLAELGVWDSIPSYRFVGNYRREYFARHRKRLQAQAESEIFSKLPTQRTLLYAPTWRDADQATTFFDTAEKIFKELPSSWNLIVKLHPLLIQRDPALFYRLAAVQDQPNALVIHEYPAVYPILEKIDAYLGDYSSVGYDCLAFQKPMFFLTRPQCPRARLHTCGEILDPEKNLFLSIERSWESASARKPLQATLYRKAFHPFELKTLKAERRQDENSLHV